MYSHTVHSWCVVFSAGSCCKAALWFCLFVLTVGSLRWTLSVLRAEMILRVWFRFLPHRAPKTPHVSLCSNSAKWNISTFPTYPFVTLRWTTLFVNLRAELGDRPGVRRKLPGVMRCFVVFPPGCCRCALLKSHECLHLKRRWPRPADCSLFLCAEL